MTTPDKTENILEFDRITKNFGGLRAISSLSFGIEKEKVTALIGPNGAGKTTAINMISGVYHPTSGDILYNGENIRKWVAHERARRGIARTFQIIKLFPALDVIENVMIGRDFGFQGRSASPDSGTGQAEVDYAMELLAMFNLEDLAKKMPDELSFGQQRWLELARAIALEPQLLLLDEPSSGLNLDESETLLEKLSHINAQGCTILLIEHNMRVMSAISDYVVVLNHGQKLLSGTPDEIKNDPRVIEVYLGEE
jgi:ABC-type branched-subunit amino acid transport system ATPase component